MGFKILLVCLNINRLFKYYSIIYLHIIRLFVFGGYLNINRLFFKHYSVVIYLSGF